MNLAGTGGLSPIDPADAAARRAATTGPLSSPTAPAPAPSVSSPATPGLGTDSLANTAPPPSTRDMPDDIPAYQSPEDVALASARSSLSTLAGLAGNATSASSLANTAASARNLASNLATSTDPEIEALATKASQLADMCDKGAQAATTVDSTRASLTASPDQSLNAALGLAYDSNQLVGAVSDLKAFAGTPFAGAYSDKLNTLQQDASPGAIAANLANVDVTTLSPDTLGKLAGLRGQAPALDAALDKAASALLDRPGGVTLDQLQANPSLGQLLAGLQQSSDPAMQQKLQAAAHDWLKASLVKNCDGKQGDDGATQAVQDYTNEMVALAQTTGLGPVLKNGAQGVLNECQDNLHDVSERGKNILQQGMDFVGGLFGKLGDLVKGGFDLVGQGLDAASHLGGQAIGTVLSAAGANDLARTVEDGADGLGQGLHDFSDGFGEGVSGIAEGVDAMVSNPVGTLQGIGALITNQDGARDQMLQSLGKEVGDHGIAYALGYVAGNLAPMLLTGGLGEGGEAADVASKIAGGADLGRGASLVARVGASLLDNGDIASTVGRKLLVVAQDAKPLIDVTKALTGDVSTAGKLLVKGAGKVGDFLGQHGVNFLAHAPAAAPAGEAAGEAAGAAAGETAATVAETAATSASTVAGGQGILDELGSRLARAKTIAASNVDATGKPIFEKLQSLVPEPYADAYERLQKIGASGLPAHAVNVLRQDLTADNLGSLAGRAQDLIPRLPGMALDGAQRAAKAGEGLLGKSFKIGIDTARDAGRAALHGDRAGVGHAIGNGARSIQPVVTPSISRILALKALKSPLDLLHEAAVDAKVLPSGLKNVAIHELLLLVNFEG